MIVYPCRYDAERPVILRAVASARGHMPDERVLVVDSASPDLTYLEGVTKLGATIAPIGNTHYETGALWYAYRAHPEESFFYLLHDSTVIVRDLSVFREQPITGFQGLKNWAKCEQKHWEWAEQALLASAVPALRSGFTMLMGSMQFVQRMLLDQLWDLRFDLVLPTTKVASQAMERVWGIAYAHLGYATIPMVREWAWDKTDHGIRSDYLIKHLLHRP